MFNKLTFRKKSEKTNYMRVGLTIRLGLENGIQNSKGISSS